MPAPRAKALDVLGGTRGPRLTEDPIEMLSQLLFYSASISASKKTPSGYRYALRVNPSSGNLHPTEFHLASPQGCFHYRVSSHELEQRAAGDFGSLCFLLTTNYWREAWKYGNRAYRYCLLDAGHASESLMLAAQAIGCEARVERDFADGDIAAGWQLPEDEWPLLVIHVKHAARVVPSVGQNWICGVPNRLSAEIVRYPLIESAHSTTTILSHRSKELTAESISSTTTHGGPEFGNVVRRRRSALDFRGGDESISREQLAMLLDLATRPSSYVDLYLYVHRVRELEPGAYRYVRDPRNLELLKPGDQRVMAAALSLGQDLAGNSCVTFSMIADLDKAIAEHGDRGYRYAHFEAGAIGQRLYTAAEALGLQSTGIGAFYDDLVHDYLGLKPGQGQVIYHFACGDAVQDDRLVVTVDDLK
jgi:SagB-type dehydrogenase family enzyme